MKTLVPGMYIPTTSCSDCIYLPNFSHIQDVAQKTNEMAGDGTMAATVLASAIYTEGVKNVAAGCNLMDLHQGSQAAVDRVVEFLATNTKTITEISQVTTISANGDVHVGNLITQAVEKVGKEGGHHRQGGPDHRGRDRDH